MQDIVRYTVDYALTITLKPHNYKHLAEDQYEKVKDEINLIFKRLRLRDNIKITLLSEMTKAYNIHLHGILAFNMDKHKCQDYLKYIYDIFRSSKTIGYVYVKPVVDYNIWKDYITKKPYKWMYDDYYMNPYNDILQLV